MDLSRPSRDHSILCTDEYVFFCLRVGKKAFENVMAAYLVLLKSSVFQQQIKEASQELSSCQANSLSHFEKQWSGKMSTAPLEAQGRLVG